MWYLTSDLQMVNSVIVQGITSVTVQGIMALIVRRSVKHCKAYTWVPSAAMVYFTQYSACLCQYLVSITRRQLTQRNAYTWYVARDHKSTVVRKEFLLRLHEYIMRLPVGSSIMKKQQNVTSV